MLKKRWNHSIIVKKISSSWISFVKVRDDYSLVKWIKHTYLKTFNIYQWTSFSKWIMIFTFVSCHCKPVFMFNFLFFLYEVVELSGHRRYTKH